MALLLAPALIRFGDRRLTRDEERARARLSQRFTALVEAGSEIAVHRVEAGPLQELADLEAEAMRLSALEDSLVTSFVTDNFDNVLGPGVFMMLTQGNIYPQLTPWIEDIMSKATQKFKNDAYVRDYYQKARENEEIMNGMREMPQPTANPVTPPPTPHQLGSPAR